MSWKPQRTLAEAEALLTSPGSLHEVETCLVDGRLQRVYKNLWPSLREFWLNAVSKYSNDTYIVYEDQRLTYRQVHRRAVKVAALLQNIYGIQKGDRVGICSRNCPEYLIAFWACHLIGAVSVLANAWLPLDPLSHCLANTGCKLVILDPERAERLQPIALRILQKTTTEAFLVFDMSEPRRQWKHMESFEETLESYEDDGMSMLKAKAKFTINPEDNATIIFTSGTTGLPKGVLSTQRQFLSNSLNVLVAGFRAALRRGEELPSVQRVTPQKGILVAVPLFHVTGSTSFSANDGYNDGHENRHDEKVDSRASLIKTENVAVAGGVPSMVTDLTLSSLVGHPLEGLLFGGAPAPDTLVPRAREAFPTAMMIQAYGLTETNSIAVSFAGEDYNERPTSTGRASPVNEIRVVGGSACTCLPAGSIGEVWLRGPNVMQGYWRDPDATNAMITKDGWLRTGDVGYLDHEGFLYIKDRLKDIIIRGGENIDSVTVENALYADPRVLEAAAVGVPDERLGELVAAIVSVRPGQDGEVTEASLIAQAKSRLPRFAHPVMVIIMTTPFVRTPSGKIIKGDLRKIARKQWELRQHGEIGSSGRQRLANL